MSEPVFPIMHSGNVDDHLANVHGLICPEPSGPCDDSTVAQHRILHWPRNNPDHEHRAGYPFETSREAAEAYESSLTLSDDEAGWYPDSSDGKRGSDAQA